MERVVVTGGAGFIGSNLCRRLLSQGAKVTVIDNLSTGRLDNLAEIMGDIQFIHGDILDHGCLNGALVGAEVVFHQAALPSVQRSVEDPLASNRANVEGTLNVLWTAKQQGARRVVLAGSSSAYGGVKELVKTEELPAAPLSPYAVSKYAGELYGGVFARLWGLEVVTLRYFNVFGPRQNPSSQYAAVIPRFITRMATGERPLIYGNGEQSRDFTYVDNVVEANLLAARTQGVSGQVFNIGCGARHTVLELVEEINRVLGTSIVPEHAPPRQGDVLHSQASIDKARRLLGYEPQVGFAQGLERTVGWLVGLSLGEAAAAAECAQSKS